MYKVQCTIHTIILQFYKCYYSVFYPSIFYTTDYLFLQEIFSMYRAFIIFSALKLSIIFMTLIKAMEEYYSLLPYRTGL